MVRIDVRSFRRVVSGLLSVAILESVLASPVVAETAPRKSPAVSPVMPDAAAQPPAYPPPAYPPPAYPPPAYGPPPAYPPPPYGPPPTYNLAPAPYRAQLGPRRMPYEDGQAVPPGYHVEEKVRQGPTIAGALLLGIPYLLGLTIAAAADFKGQSGWLAVPAAGPWLMLFTRKSAPDCTSSSSTSASDCFDNGVDWILRFYLIVDGALQATGTGLLSFGLSGRKLLIRDDLAFSVKPMPMGSHGYGPALVGRF